MPALEVTVPAGTDEVLLRLRGCKNDAVVSDIAASDLLVTWPPVSFASCNGALRLTASPRQAQSAPKRAVWQPRHALLLVPTRAREYLPESANAQQRGSLTSAGESFNARRKRRANAQVLSANRQYPIQSARIDPRWP